MGQENRETELSSVMNALSMAVENYHSEVAMIEDRFAPILRTENKEKVPGALGAINPEFMTAIPQRINDLVGQIVSLNSKLSGIRSRTEL